MQNLGNENFLLAFVALTGVAVLLQAIVLLAIFVTLRKTARSIQEQVQDIRTSVLPVLDNTQALLADTRALLGRVGPRIESATTDLAEITRGLRVQTVEVQVTAQDIMQRVRKQSGRIDGMVSTVLDGVDKAAEFVAGAVSRPMRQASAVLASLKAAMESLRKPAHSTRPEHAPESDKDMFV
jgi:uncharacterized protein YoxC